MPEPVIPAGATIAGFVMAVIGWYGMLRTGVQFVHDDIENHRSVKKDVSDMLVDLDHYKNEIEKWNRSWHISHQTPNAVLVQYWGARRLNIINQKLGRIKSDLEKARRKMGRLAAVGESGWTEMNRARKFLCIEGFIWAKRKYIKELIDGLPKNMTIINQESDAGWVEQSQRLDMEIAHVTPYHTQVAHLLVRIAMHNLKDAKALQICCQRVQSEVAILLDLDLFDAFTTGNEQHHNVERIGEVLEAGHLKLELLLHQRDVPSSELTRVVVEKVSDVAAPDSTIINAFKAILGTGNCNPCFASDTSAIFRLSKHRRPRDPCGTFQNPLGEVIENQDVPCYNTVTEKFRSHQSILNELSKARAAFELAQVCLLFLRTNWIAELCRCTVRCGSPRAPSMARWHQFGLEFAQANHRQPLRCRQDPSEESRQQPWRHSWCMTDNNWYGLIKPIRHLGLLLVEIFLGTIVFPQTTNDSSGAAPVERIYMHVKTEAGASKWHNVSIRVVRKLVRRSFSDSEFVAGAIEHCLTGSFPFSPSDDEMEAHLRRFYFKVVKPFKDIYDIQLKSRLLYS